MSFAGRIARDQTGIKLDSLKETNWGIEATIFQRDQSAGPTKKPSTPPEICAAGGWVKWVRIEEILTGDYHPALLQASLDILARRAFEEMLETLSREPTGGANDAELARAARRMLLCFANSPTQATGRDG